MDLGDFGVIDKAQLAKTKDARKDAYIQDLKNKGVKSAEYDADLKFSTPDKYDVIKPQIHYTDSYAEVKIFLPAKEVERLKKIFLVRESQGYNINREVLISLMDLIDTNKLKLKDKGVVLNE